MAPPVPDSTLGHFKRVAAFYDRASPSELPWGARSYRRLLSRYYNLLIPEGASVLEIGCGRGELLAQIHAGHKAGIDVSPRQIESARARLPQADLKVLSGEELGPGPIYDVIIISDTLNQAADVQRLLAGLRSRAGSDTRLIVNFQNTLWRPLLTLARAFGLKSREPTNSWLAASDVRNLLALAGWQLIRQESRILLPLSLGGLESILNRALAPLLQWFCLTVFMVARPEPVTLPANPRRVSVVVPARNEGGNIADVIRDIPEMGAGTEIIFVEGQSTDDTWHQIQTLAGRRPGCRVKTLRQPGRGKGDAVRAGFAASSGDILMILDADLTVPATELPKFYEVVASGRAEFANGVRLVYPLGEKAMPFLNLCANKAFSLAFTWLLGQPVKDTLCGTKVLTRQNYERIAKNRAYFGDFDPFGDFDLLFGAAKLNLKIADVPVRYRQRTYGTTNIQRWRHGLLLVRMVAFAARKLRFV
jgi:SAM-dependent methyltransferase